MPRQAWHPCAWCYYERNFITDDDYKKSRCYKCDNNFCKFTNAIWKYRRRNYYLQKVGRIFAKQFPCALEYWRNTERLPF